MNLRGPKQGSNRNRAANRLTVLVVKNAAGPSAFEDGAGLRLIVTETGQKHWVVRVTVAGKRISRGLGSFPDVTLSDARENANAARRGARNGVDATLEARQQLEQIEIPKLTFREAFNRYFEQVKRPILKPGRFAERWPEPMGTSVYHTLGNRPVADVAPAEIIDLLQPLWHSKRDTANRLLQRMTVAFQSALVRGDRVHANPCQGVRDELGRSRPKVQHRRALPWEKVPAFVVELEQRPRLTEASRLVLLFTIFTACRSEEVRGAQWLEKRPFRA